VLLTRGEFEVISWLVAIGTLIAVILTAAYPVFDPAAALFGHFPRWVPYGFSLRTLFNVRYSTRAPPSAPAVSLRPAAAAARTNWP